MGLKSKMPIESVARPVVDLYFYWGWGGVKEYMTSFLCDTSDR